MSYVMQFNQPGGPEALRQSTVDIPTPGPGELRVRQEAIGLNFIDVYHRTGLYPLPMPGIPGVEGAGIVDAVGDGVDRELVGRRVVYAGVPGAYAQVRIIPSWRAVTLADDIAAEIAGSTLLRGLTAHMLLTKVYPVTAGSTLLVHAAAGGLGAILTRWAKHLGATVIGTVSHPDKEAIARQNGADEVSVGRDADIASRVAEWTDGKGVHLAIDGIGGNMLAKTLACVRPFGIVASIGQAGGAPPPISLDALGPGRSISLARPSVMRYSADETVYSQAVPAVLSIMKTGILTGPRKRYGLSEVAFAHSELEAGHITGSAVLIP